MYCWIGCLIWTSTGKNRGERRHTGLKYEPLFLPPSITAGAQVFGVFTEGQVRGHRPCPLAHGIVASVTHALHFMAWRLPKAELSAVT